jgi:hypothetical protein
MDALRTNVLAKLRESREELLGIPKDQLTGPAIMTWLSRWEQTTFRRASSLDQFVYLDTSIRYRTMSGFAYEEDYDICLELRDRIVAELDQAVALIDETHVVRPVLDSYITKVADTKLATLLQEFNSIRTTQPNAACITFRTILPLIIRERAKRVDPTHRLATKDDIGFEPDIKAAVAHGKLFNMAEMKLLSRYLSDGNKDSFDNVAHKPDYLVHKDELDAAVNLLNRLLPVIVD